jgi:nitrile hydratase accessory protein
VSVVEVELPVDGVAAPPRANGELVFAEPWESRAFGVALSLHQAGVFPWEDFQAALIAAIAEDERTRAPDAPYSYYRCWLTALEAVLADLGLVDAEQLRERVAELLARPAGHDHDHEHGHEHGHDHSHG